MTFDESVNPTISRRGYTVTVNVWAALILVAVAQTFLASRQIVGAEPPAMRTVSTGYGESISKDGRFITFTDWSTGKIMLRDLRLEKTIPLTTGSYPEFGMYSQISPNNDWIAYSWSTKDSGFELRIIKLDGTMQTTVLAKKSMEYYVRDWSPGGDQILVEIMDDDTEPAMRLALVSVANGAVQSEYTLNQIPGKSEHVRVSPNGKLLAYTTYGGSSRDINLYSIERREEINIVSHPADDWLMDWGPDGRWLLFLSDRGGRFDLWATPISATLSSSGPAEAVRLASDLGGWVSPLGMGDGGSLYYRQRVWENDLFVVDYAPGSAALGSPKKVASGLDYWSGPAWLPDGKRLGYFRDIPGTQASSARGRHSLVLHTLGDGAKHELPLELVRYHWMNPSWSADASSILLGAKLNGQGSLVMVQTETGKVTTLVQGNKPDGVVEWPTGSPTAMAYFVRGKGIVGRNMETGQETQVYSPESESVERRPVSRLSLSTDGARLAFLESRDSLLVIDLGNRQTERVFAAGKGKVLHQFAWTPSDDHIVFGLSDSIESDVELQLWQIDTSTWKATRLSNVSMLGRSMGGISVHRDGRKIAFTAARITPDAVWDGTEVRDEVRAVDNLGVLLKSKH